MNSQVIQEDQLNVGLVEFNQLLLDAHNYFQQRDLENAILSYQQALDRQESQQDLEKLAVIKTNLGIILFHNCEYKKAVTMLLEALPILDKKNEFKCALILKILGNLAIIKLIMTDFQECKDYNDQAIQLILGSPSPLKYQLFKELMYIYFRFTSFEAMGDGNFENLEQKYDGISLACFYSSMGLNRELCQDLNLALKYHKRALQIWIDLKESGFIVITLKRLIQLCQQSNQDSREYQTQLNQYMSSSDLKGISQEVLFKDCDKKLQCARDITNSLKKIEDHLNQLKNQELLSKPLQVQNNNEFWKLALKIRLKQAIQFCYNLLVQQPQNQEHFHKSITQLQHSLQLLDSPQPYENYLQNLPFTKESINLIKSQMIKLNRILIKYQLEPFFEYLYQTQQFPSQNKFQLQNQQLQQQQQFKIQQQQQQIIQIPQQNPQSYESYTGQVFQSEKLNQFGSNIMQSQQQQFQNPQQYQQVKYQSQQQTKPGQFPQKVQNTVFSKPLNQSQMSNSSRLKNTQVLNGAYRVVQIGDYLTKCNKNTNGRIQRYFQLGLDNTFRWAAKDKQINDPNKINFYQVSEIRGLVYGKVTEVLIKSYNKELEPYLCFSMIMKTRSMDFYLTDKQIDYWVIALSEEIKRKNSKAFVISPGRYYWRKMKLILAWHFVEKNKKYKKQKGQKFSFAKLICIFRDFNFKFPQN